MLYIGFWFTNLIWDISSEMRGFFPPSSSYSSTNFSVHRPRLLVRCLQATPPPGRACVPTCMPTCSACSHPAACTCTWRYDGKLQTLSGRDVVTFAPSVWPPPSEAENLGRRTKKRTPVGPSGLLPKRPLFSRTQTGFMSDWSRKGKVRVLEIKIKLTLIEFHLEFAFYWRYFYQFIVIHGFKKWTQKSWHIHKMEYNTAKKMNKLLPATTWVNLTHT